MIHATLLIPAMILDAVFGEPDWLWRRLMHPAVVMGRMVGWLDRWLNHGDRRMAKGAIAVIGLVAVALVVGMGISWLGGWAEILVAAVLLAQKSLVDHVRDVASGLRQSVAAGRSAVARIVSRDTDGMTGAQVARSAIESAAENLSDGVVAPAFWFLIAGAPGILIYKAVNTADSMIGYRTPDYDAFGRVAARLDDLLNLIPARLTCLLIAGPGGLGRAWTSIMTDANRHLSPNAGWPEAAMARRLDIALAGPRSYDGQMRELAWVNGDGRREIGAGDIDRAVAVLWHVWWACLIGLGGFGLAGLVLSP